MRFATRTLHGVGDDGGREEILIWIERRPGAVWAVGRAIDIDNRKTPRPRPDDYVFEGYEMGDALSAANNALEDDLKVSAGEGVNEAIAPFAEDELLKPLERWFFGHKH
jgi:hypothetical protein